MGKTQKPLKIIALPPCNKWETLDKLEAQGHTIIRIVSGTPCLGLVNDFLDADIILGARCWRMDIPHEKYLPVAIKEARVLRYGNTKSREEKHDVKVRSDISSSLDLD